MLGALRSLFSPPKPTVFDAPLRIDRPTYAIGDVHGRFDLLAPLVRAVAEDATSSTEPPRLVLMGDYVDRGERSREVLDYALDLVGDDPGTTDGDVVMLRGNHEEMLLGFLADPVEAGPRWLRNGGLQTLLSYGVGGAFTANDPDALAQAASALRRAMGETAEKLAALPRCARYGDVFFAHAGADPALPVAAQPERALVWGAPQFRHAPRQDGIWVVHGHYVVDEADAAHGRIAVDTGAYFSGRLTAARLRDGEVHFIEVAD